MRGLGGELILNFRDFFPPIVFLFSNQSDCLTQYHFKKTNIFLTLHIYISLIKQTHKALKGYKEIPKERSFGVLFSIKFLIRCWKCYLMSIYLIFPWHEGRHILRKNQKTLKSIVMLRKQSLDL